MSAEGTPLPRLRDHVGDSREPANRAGEIVRALDPPPALGRAADARVLAALRREATAGPQRLRRLALQAAAFAGVALSGFGAIAGLTWLRSARDTDERAAVAKAPERRAVERANAAPPAPAIARDPAADTRARPARAPSAPQVVEPELAIDPQRPPYRLRVPSDLARPGVVFSASLRVCVSATGDVTSATLLRGAHPRLDARMVEAVRKWKYRPARRDGRPLPSCTLVDYRVTIEAPGE